MSGKDKKPKGVDNMLWCITSDGLSTGSRVIMAVLVLLAVVGVVDITIRMHGGNLPGSGSGFGRGWNMLQTCSTSKSVRRFESGDTFGTIFHLEIQMFYNMLETDADVQKLVKTLKAMETTGMKNVFYSMKWEYGQPEEGATRYSYLDRLAETACKNTDLKVGLIVDLLHPPAWVFAKYPDAKPWDADGRKYPRLSWFHGPANALAHAFLGDVASHLATKFPGCVTAIQPVYNNEYEAKYTQEYDAFQDYSPAALAEFQTWLVKQQPKLATVNSRWGTAFKTWEEVVPPKLHSGDLMGLDFSSRYWDFIHFREVFGAEVYNRACATVHGGGLQCFHHFPEFFSVIDAIYGATMFKHIAASPYTDFVIMDSNFATPYGTLMNTAKLRLYVSAGLPYNKPVYFEAAVERFKEYKVLEDGFRNAMLAGANLGITNWHTRVDMNSSLAGAMKRAVPQCKACELVGVFIPLDTCSGFHGLQHQWERRDPLHDWMEHLAEQLTERCEADLIVYIELDRFLADMHTFNRAVFVEPMVLYGQKELNSYIRVKSLLPQVPHEILHMPVNVTVGPQLMVLQGLADV